MHSARPSIAALRPATTDDIGQIIALEQAVPTAPHWSVSEYEACLAADTMPRRLLLVAEANGLIIGFIAGKVLPLGAGEPPHEALAEIESVAVSPSLRRQRTGTLLCRAMLDWFHAQDASEVHLEVRSSSAGAIALYRSLGFQQQGLRRAYYRDPVEDAVAMRLDRCAEGRPT